MPSPDKLKNNVQERPAFTRECLLEALKPIEAKLDSLHLKIDKLLILHESKKEIKEILDRLEHVNSKLENLENI